MAEKINGGRSESKSTKVQTFELEHTKSQGPAFESQIKTAAPQNAKVVVLTELDPSLSYQHIYLRFPADEKAGAISLKDAFDNLKDYYGSNISFKYIDSKETRTLKSVLKKVYAESMPDRTAGGQNTTFGTLRTNTKNILRTPSLPSTNSDHKSSERWEASVRAAYTYMSYNLDIERSGVMFNEVQKAVAEQPEAMVFVVAGALHVSDIKLASGEENLNEMSSDIIARDRFIKSMSAFNEEYKGFFERFMLFLTKRDNTLSQEEFARQGLLGMAEKVYASDTDLKRVLEGLR